ncbi:MAG: allantoicase [Pseudomonadales bacterium]|nr:allantoicase [Pseudomonadales bacterium]
MNKEHKENDITQLYVDLAAERLGGETLDCSDDFFAEMENLLKPGRGVFIDDKYTERGKWMDGWESRRSYGRNNGRDSDWCLIALGVPGVIKGFDVDTNHFRGNAPESVSIEACHSAGNPEDDQEWTCLLENKSVNAHSQNLFEVESDAIWTHLRLTMFPDGGIARFRVYGDPEVDPRQFLPGELIDLASIKNGGKALLCSDMFFSDKNNLLMPGRGKDMGDGWETKRRRDPGPDWSIVKLAFEGSVAKVLLDTAHFKGNFPDRFSLEGTTASDEDVMNDKANWQAVLPEIPLQANHEHIYFNEILSAEQSFSHIRLNIFPDGGVSRLRIFGYRAIK